MVIMVAFYSEQNEMPVNAVDLINEVREALELQKHIMSAVYGVQPNQKRKEKAKREKSLDTIAKKFGIKSAGLGD